MNNFIIYSIEIAISLALFYSAYWLFLKKETFFQLNRFYLMSTLVIALLIPILNITIGTGMERNSFITKYLITPFEEYEQNVLVTIDDQTTQTNAERTPFQKVAHSRSRESVDESGDMSSDAAQTHSSHSSEAGDSNIKIDWLTIVCIIYFIGVVFFLTRFIVNFIRIFTYASRNKVHNISGLKVIRMKKNISPFSFLNFIFISQEEYEEEELIKIIAHEKIHIQQRHSLDLILLELLLAFQWFNPFVWLYKRSIKITHEYLADQGTLKSGVDLPSYQYSLLNQILRENNFEIASNYNLIIKKRMAMMMKKRSTRLAALKLVIALPILCFLFSAFAFKTNYSKKEVTPDNYIRVKLPGGTDTLIKEEKIPAEYLKLLEGEYIAMKGTQVLRKIKFTRVLGALIGNDNGYRYKITPVGNEKFINPDDGVELVFDTKNKKAITLLLFGTTLNKVDASKETAVQKKSVAYSTAAVLEKDGIEAALSQYKEIKNSDKYDLNEAEMNLVGYRLLQTGKAKEASSVFKLNAEAFPKSFKAYSSYADGLLAAGDKTQAIENYKKSIELNPGSKNALKKLAELGVNADNLSKKVTVPAEELKLLEGYYFSTNEPWGIRKIKFMEEEGTLVGDDHGYRYKLHPVGNGKFINPDDGESLVFNTQNKNAITLLLFGKINLEKANASKDREVTVAEAIKKVTVSAESLKLLEGEYISSNDPNGVRKIIFSQKDGELWGSDNGYRYKLIPVGEGKFINPDDGAKVEFDTKNKNAITLLLFGSINLNKVK